MVRDTSRRGYLKQFPPKLVPIKDRNSGLLRSFRVCFTFMHAKTVNASAWSVMHDVTFYIVAHIQFLQCTDASACISLHRIVKKRG